MVGASSEHTNFMFCDPQKRGPQITEQHSAK